MTYFSLVSLYYLTFIFYTLLYDLPVHIFIILYKTITLVSMSVCSYVRHAQATPGEIIDGWRIETFAQKSYS